MVAVSSKADIAKLRQLLYASCQAEVQAVEESSHATEGEVKSILTSKAARIARLLSLCAKVSASRQHKVSEEVMQPKPADTEQVLKEELLQEQAAEAMQRVLQLRSQAPTALVAELSKVMEQCRPQPGDESDVTNGSEATTEEDILFSPAATSLQNLLSNTSHKLPSLGAKLDEALERLKRAVAALEQENARSEPNTVERIFINRERTGSHLPTEGGDSRQAEFVQHQLAKKLRASR